MKATGRKRAREVGGKEMKIHYCKKLECVVMFNLHYGSCEQRKKFADAIFCR